MESAVAMPPDLLPRLVWLAVLLALSAFFSGSETALFSLSRMQVQRLRESGGRTGRAVADLLSLPRRLLITILVGNMVVNTTAASVVAVMVTTSPLGKEGVWVAIVGTALLLLVFGEVTPKTLAARKAEALSRAVALPLLWFSVAIFPVRRVLRYITNAVLFVLQRGHIQSEGLLTRHEFAAALEVSEERGAIDEHEREMVEHIFEFRQVAARELMVPRTEIACVGEDATIAEALETARRSGHSRLPVYTRDIDDVWGVFDVRDLPAWRDQEVWGLTIRQFVHRRGEGAEAQGRRPLVWPAFLVPETRHVGDLLRDMREGSAHMAILLDEYGGTAGLVTLRQLIDELVGGVLATGRGEAPFYHAGYGRIQVLGEARIRDLNHELGLDLPLGRSDTIGGYVTGLFGQFPRAGDTVTDDRFVYRVLGLAGRRVGALEIRPREGESPAWRELWGGTAPEAPGEPGEGTPC